MVQAGQHINYQPCNYHTQVVWLLNYIDSSDLCMVSAITTILDKANKGEILSLQLNFLLAALVTKNNSPYIYEHSIFYN